MKRLGRGGNKPDERIVGKNSLVFKNKQESQKPVREARLKEGRSFGEKNTRDHHVKDEKENKRVFRTAAEVEEISEEQEVSHNLHIGQTIPALVPCFFLRNLSELPVGEDIDFMGDFHMRKDFLGYGNPLLVGELQIHRLSIDHWIGSHERVVEVEDDDIPRTDVGEKIIRRVVTHRLSSPSLTHIVSNIAVSYPFG